MRDYCCVVHMPDSLHPTVYVMLDNFCEVHSPPKHTVVRDGAGMYSAIPFHRQPWDMVSVLHGCPIRFRVVKYSSPFEGEGGGEGVWLFGVFSSSFSIVSSFLGDFYEACERLAIRIHTHTHVNDSTSVPI